MHTLELALRNARPDQLEHVCLIVARAFERTIGSPDTRHDLSRRPWHMIEPRIAAEIALRDPRSGLILWEAVERMMGFEWQEDFAIRFLDYTMHSILRRETFESADQIWMAWLQLLRAVGGTGVWSGYLDRRGIRSEFFDRMFDERRLLELSEYNPERVLAYIQVLRELGGGQSIERFVEREMGPEFFKRMLDPRRLLELSERNPEAALAYIQVLRELGGGQFIERFVEREMGPASFKRMLDPRRLLELSESQSRGGTGLHPSAP